MTYIISAESRELLQEVLLNIPEASIYEDRIPKEIKEFPSLYFANFVTIVISDYTNGVSKKVFDLIDYIANIEAEKYPPSVLADFTTELLEKINDHIGLNDPEINAHLTDEMKKTILTV